MLAEEKRTIVAVHSYKGGTGKTLISTNLATLFAARGKKTCLLDMDFLAPSLHSLFKICQRDYWLNDYLNGACRLDKVLKNFCYEGLEKEKLFIGFANPSTEAIREMAAKDRKWEMQALARLLSIRESSFGGLGFDYLLFTFTQYSTRSQRRKNGLPNRKFQQYGWKHHQFNTIHTCERNNCDLLKLCIGTIADGAVDTGSIR